MRTLELKNIVLLLQIQLANGFTNNFISNDKLGSTNSHIESSHFSVDKVLDQFSPCTSALITPNKSAVFDIKPRLNPIFAFNGGRLDNNSILSTADFVRKYISKQCWIFIVLLPERDESFLAFDGDIDENEPVVNFIYNQLQRIRLTNHDCCVPKYYIFLTTLKDEFVYHFIRILPSQVLNFMEFVVAEVALCVSGLVVLSEIIDDQVVLHFINHYYFFPRADISHPSYSITCMDVVFSNCMEKLDTVAEFVSKLNKYFWITDLLKIIPNSSFREGSKNGHFHKTVENLAILFRSSTPVNFDDFFGLWILEEVFRDLNQSENLSPNFVLHRKKELYMNPLYTEIIIYDEVGFSFLSCHKVHRYLSPLNPLTSPFDNITWIFALCTCVSVILITGSRSSSRTLSGFVTMGICMENSILLVYQSSLFGKKYGTFSAIIFGVFMIFFGTMLTNWYKTSFTKEIIIPAKYHAPWKTFYDIRNFKIWMPVEAVLSNSQFQTLADEQLHYWFYMRLTAQLTRLAEYEGKSKIGRENRDVALAFLNGIKEEEITSNGRQEKQLKPLRYRDVTEFVNNLTICDNAAYMDLPENIENILHFMNDNGKEKVFLQGDGGFFSAIHGWSSESIKNNYAWHRIKVMISSGIYSFWEKWFKMAMPIKLFQHYANWTYPKVDKVAKLDFSSKISTAFYIFGILVVICILSLFAEFVFHKALPKSLIMHNLDKVREQIKKV